MSQSGGRIQRLVHQLGYPLWSAQKCWSITAEGTITWWCADDNHQRERKIDFETRLDWFWRIWCWLAGHHRDESANNYYGCCVFCRTAVPGWYRY